MKKISYTRKKIWLIFTLIGLTVSIVSCKDDDDDYAMSNQEFVTKASSSNNFDVAAGGLAVTKGNSAVVTQYGQHMVADHGAAGMEMKNLASEKSWAISDQLQPKEQALIGVLTPLSGNAFDKEFARIMVDSHMDAVALFEKASASMGVPDQDLRNFASAKLPTLKAHLQKAIELKAAVNP